jgi:opacity protein-like surface antigen
MTGTRFGISFAALTAVAGLAGGAQAGGMAEPIMTPAPAPVAVAPAPISYGADWSGFYAGAQVGYGLVDSVAFGETGKDYLYGVHVGYNYDFGSLVVGGELDYDGTQIKDTASGINLDSVARLKARVGYDAGSYMPYLVGGLAQATTSGALSESDTGAFAGVGLDYRITDSISVGGEALRHQFKDFGGSGADIYATTVAARVTFHF